MKRLQDRKWWGESEISRTLLGEIKQHASGNGQGCENSGNAEMLRETWETNPETIFLLSS